MKYIYLALNWLLGLFIGLIGVVTLLDSLLGGLCLIVASLLLLPPVRIFFYGKIRWEIPIRVRAAIILILLITFGFFKGQSMEREATKLRVQQAEEHAEKLAEIRRNNVIYFNKNKKEIISSVSLALSKNDYQLVMSQAGRYLSANDVELNEIYNKAKQAQEKIQNELKTKEILTQLKKIPSAQFSVNKDLYKQLITLNPDNAAYKKKFSYYEQQLNEKLKREQDKKDRIKRQREARIAKFGEPPIRSEWDRSYYEVERYLKKVANDPDSIEIDSCTTVSYIKSGWLVGCDYRGRNGFGGMIRQSNWFTIIHGQVVQMHDASAYNQ